MQEVLCNDKPDHNNNICVVDKVDYAMRLILGSVTILLCLIAGNANYTYHIRDSMSQIEYFNINRQGFERLIYLYTFFIIFTNQIPFNFLESKAFWIRTKNSLVVFITFLMWIYCIRSIIFKKKDIQLA